MTSKEPIVYLNGHYQPKSKAAISVDERGMLFADGVYEVLRYYAGRSLAIGMHITRMRQSLDRVRITPPADFDAFAETVKTLLEKNRLGNAKVYWQITRGAAPRNPAFPKGVSPTVLIVADPAPALVFKAPVQSVAATLMHDERWSNCWIKSLQLLPNVLAFNAAMDAGFGAVILHRDGLVTESSSANAMIVRDGELWTHPADRWILNGVTRQIVLQLARKNGINVHEHAFTTDQLLTADEALITGTSVNVTAVTHVDHQPIGEGEPGPVTIRLHKLLVNHIQRECLGQRE